MKCHIKVCAVLGGLAAMPAALAAPGDLDPTFGVAGRVFFEDPQDHNWPMGGVLLPDGKVVVARANISDQDDFSVLRFHPDGSLDTSFDQDGRTSLDLPGIKGTTRYVFLQPDGKILVLGWIRENQIDPERLGLVRYLTDGSLDRSYGNSGLVRLDAQFGNFNLGAVLLDSGQLLIAGRAVVGTTESVAIARFNPDGSLDRAFGQDGYAVSNNLTREWFNQFSRQPDGKLLLFMDTSGMSRNWYDTRPNILRFDANGEPDTSFGTDGRARLLNETAFSTAAVLSDGKILAALADEPAWWDGFFCGAMLTRVDPAGQLDDTFDSDGMRDVPLGDCHTFGASSLAEPDGRVFLNGAQAIFAPSNGYLDSYDHVITRVDAEGRLDASFGLGGQAVIDVGEGPNPPHGEFGSQLLRQDDGKLLVLTTAYRADAQGHVNTPIVLARLQASGGSPGLIGIKGLEPIGHEGDGNIAVRIRRSGGAEGIVSVDYTTSSGSATSNLDFTPASGGLTWADGDREDKIVSINVAADAISEGRESFKLALSNASGGATLATSSVLISIDPPVVQSPPAQAPPPANNSGGGGGAMSWEFLLALMLAMLALNTCRRNRPHQGPPGGGIPVASKLGTSTFSALGSMIVF